MSHQNAVIGFPRHTPDATFTGGSWVSDYPVTNLGTTDIARVARSADLDAANTQCVATLSKRRSVRLLGIVGHNMTVNAEMRLRLYSDAALSDQLYDSGTIPVWPVVFPLAECNWNDPFHWWRGKYSPAELMNTRWLRPIWLDRQYFTRAIKLEFTDPDNAAGYIQIGMLEIAEGWQLGVNPSFGAQFGMAPESRRQKALGGTVYTERRRAKRVFRGTLDYLDHDEAQAKAFELFRQHDYETPFLWLPDPVNTKHWVRDAALVRNAEIGLLAHSELDVDQVPLNLEEV